jgi:hypothetical protein
MSDPIPEADSLPSARLSECQTVQNFVREQLISIGAAIVKANGTFSTAIVINLSGRFPRVHDGLELSGICTMLIIKELEEKGYDCQVRAAPEVHLRISWGQSSKKEELEEAANFLASRIIK